MYSDIFLFDSCVCSATIKDLMRDDLRMNEKVVGEVATRVGGKKLSRGLEKKKSTVTESGAFVWEAS